MSAYVFLFSSLICLLAGAIWNSDAAIVMGVVFICSSVIVARCDKILSALLSKEK